MPGAALTWHELLVPPRCHLQPYVATTDDVGDSPPLGPAISSSFLLSETLLDFAYSGSWRFTDNFVIISLLIQFMQYLRYDYFNSRIS